MANELATSAILRGAHPGARVPVPTIGRTMRRVFAATLPARRRTSPSPSNVSSYQVRSSLGDGEMTPDDYQAQAEEQIKNMSTQEQLRVIEAVLEIPAGSVQIKTGLFSSDFTFSAEALPKIVEHRDRANAAFWRANLVHSMTEKFDVDESHKEARRVHLDKLRDLALALQQLTDGAGISQPSRPLSGLGAFVFTASGMLVLKIVGVLVALIVSIWIIKELAISATQGVIGEGMKGISNGLNRQQSEDCEEIARQRALLLRKGIQNLTSDERASLETLNKLNNECLATWFGQLTKAAAFVGGGYLLWKLVRPLLRKRSRERDTSGEPGIFGKAWAGIKGVARGEGQRVRDEYQLHRDFMDCYRAAVAAAGPRPKSRGPTPKAWKDAYSSCASTKFTKIPTKISSEFKRLARLTGME